MMQRNMNAIHGSAEGARNRRVGETTELASAQAARKRRSRQRLRDLAVSEEAAGGHAADASKKGPWRQREHSGETEEGTEARPLRDAGSVCQSSLQQCAGETPGEASERSAVEAAPEKRRWHQQQLAGLLPELAAERRAVHTIRLKLFRQQQRAVIIPEQGAEHRAVIVPEQGAERRAADSERKRRWCQRQLAIPEMAAQLRAADAAKKRYHSRLAIMTPEERVEFRAAQAAKQRHRRQARRAEMAERQAAVRPACDAEALNQVLPYRRAGEMPEEAAESRAAPATKVTRPSHWPQHTAETPEEAHAQRMADYCEQQSVMLRHPNIPNHCDITPERYQQHVVSLLAYKNRVPAQQEEPIPVIDELFCCPGCEDVFALAGSLSRHLKRKAMLVVLSCETCRRDCYFFNKCLAYAHVQQHFPYADVPKLESIVSQGSVAKYGPVVPPIIEEELQQLEETIESLVHSYRYRQVNKAAVSEN